MFLRCSYFFPNLSLDVLIDMVLNQKNACIIFAGDSRGSCLPNHLVIFLLITGECGFRYSLYSFYL